MLDVKDISVWYGPVQALKGLSLRVGDGEVVALLGANGAGKTTALCAISRVAAVRSGDVLLDGQSILHSKPSALVRRGVAHVPEGRRVFGDLSVMENLDMGAYTVADKADRSAALEQVFHYFPVLARRRAQKAGTLSGGEQQMLAVGRAMMSRPKLLLLDEPSLGLAPRLVDQVFEIIRQINSENRVSILLVEQNANEALLHADRAYVLENGRLSLEGPADELRKDNRVVEAYLGSD